MSRIILAVVAVVAVSLAALPAFAQDGRMTVAAFLDTAADIPRNPTALLRSDTRRRSGATNQAFAAVRSEQTAAQAAGRPPSHLYARKGRCFR